MKILLLCLFLLMYGCPSILFAQVNTTDDSIVYQTAVENALNKSLRIQKAINIGSEYSGAIYDIEGGHQFYLSDENLKGDILYNGIQYRDLILQYDIIQDEVITEHANGRKIILVKEKITEFTIEGHFFRRFSSGSAGNNVKPGFYEVLVTEGYLQLLAKREKKLRGQKGNLYYKKEKSMVENKNKYFLVKDGDFFPVKNYKGLIKLLSPEKNGEAFTVGKENSEETRMVKVVRQHTRLKDEL